MLKEKVLSLAQNMQARTVAIRQHLHMYPELSFREEQTGKYIQQVLKDLGIAYTDSWAGHGVVGIIEGNKPDSKVLALRADIDALPIMEENEVEYKSRNAGVMHACGHDVHTSSLLSCAGILQSLRTSFNGTVKLIFQPGEEKHPGGASILIEEGVLENPKPSVILGQHVYPQMEAGLVGFRQGPSMASSDEIHMQVRGKGGHGAAPHETVDPIAITATLISALQQVVSRRSNPATPSVLTFGKINSDGGSFNIIPNAVSLLGTFRTFDEAWRKEAHELIRKVCHGIAESFGAEVDLEILVGYPALENDPELTAFCRESAIELLGEERVKDIPIRLTSEDFAYYSKVVPGCFYRLGVANESKGITHKVHTSRFDIDNLALITGPALMSWLAISQLNAH